VYTVVTAIAESAAKIEFDVQRNDESVTNHDFLKLMRRPNPNASQFQFLEMHFTFMNLMGESYWYIVRGNKTLKPKEIYLIRPDCMEVVLDKDGEVSGYVLTKPGGVKVPFDKEEILHHKLPNPYDPNYGLGPVQAAKIYIQTEDYAADWTRNSMYNSGRPSGIVTIKGTITEEQFASVKRQFKEQYSGTANAGKTLMIKGTDGIEFQKIGMELQEVALKELKEMTRDDIMMMFRVSKTMLGISEGVTLNNARESREMFRENITVPQWDRLTDHLAAFLLPLWGDQFTLEYKNTVYKTVDQELAEDIASVDKWETKNEIRLKRDLEPIPGGDILYQPINMVPMLEDPIGAAEDKAAADQAAADQAAQTAADNAAAAANQGDTQSNDTPPADMPPADMPPDTSGKSVKKKEVRQLQIDVFKKMLFDTQNVWEKKYLRFFIGEFNTQLKQILGKNKKDTLHNWYFDVDASQQRIMGTLLPMGQELMKAAALYALEVANDTATQFSITEEIQRYVHERIDKMARATNDDTIASITDTIGEGISQGESVDQLRKRIQVVYEEATNVRAERIARTESLAASNEGTLEAYRQSPLVNAKEWSAEADACEFCNSFDGIVIGLDEDFAKLGQGITGNEGGRLGTNYENVEHPPLHPNCRCALLPVAG
jgi:HK97 family phage portal protein